MFLPRWVAQVEAAQVEPEVKEGQLLQGANVGGQVLCIPRKLRETQTEHSSDATISSCRIVIFSNGLMITLNDELQVKLNEHGMKIREQQRKMIELSMKMVASLIGWRRKSGSETDPANRIMAEKKEEAVMVKLENPDQHVMHSRRSCHGEIGKSRSSKLS
ncbi:hypothetical protein K1719_037388 [Acacia pycnantha]|nr:hypothetical protein K1719_037388 [Acacia pycnantha]